MPSFIPDGYTEKAYVKAVPRLYEELRFRYRPTNSPDAAEFFDGLRNCGPREAESKTAKFMKSHLIDWTMADDKGAAVPITVDNLLRIQRSLFLRVLNIIAGVEASDEDPNAPDGQHDGRTGEEREAADEKNSSAAS